MQTKVYKVAAICGSLQQASCNRGLLRACIEANNPNINIEVMDISAIPLFNEDVEKQGAHPSVKQVFDRVKAADAVIFANPENNYLMSAPAKNVYDWLSRGGENSAVYKKPMAQLGTGVNGGNLAALHFKQVVNYCKVQLMDEPKVQVKRYQPGNFDEKGNLINPAVKKDIGAFLQAFVNFLGASNKI